MRIKYQHLNCKIAVNADFTAVFFALNKFLPYVTAPKRRQIYLHTDFLLKKSDFALYRTLVDKIILWYNLLRMF
ncbi:MAG TPA: hypothetical protein DHW16_00535 [Ruminococcaceae bacterium]|nr:hypothetical protein [Oscillospiraceae bacterium]HCO37062.1 hypothetical protein [Oscillospiraceae bacterium]